MARKRRLLAALISAAVLAVLHCELVQGSDYARRVRFSDIRALTFYQGRWTTARRTEPMPQLQCVGALCSKFEPRVVQCVSHGDSQWKVRVDTGRV